MQKETLRLPVKQFHQLHDLLGEILDYDAETNDFHMENAAIELVEDIRTELFNQIPDEEPIETTYAWTTAKNAMAITPIKLYEVKDFTDSERGFYITSDRGSEIFCIKNGCAHLSEDKDKNWNFTTITND